MLEIIEAKRWVKLRQWSEMVRTCMASGKKIKIWCKENGIEKSTYYYRLKCLRQAALADPEQASMYLANQETVTPTFAELDFTAAAEANDKAYNERNVICAAIVRIGDVEAFINNGADPAVIANMLKSIRDIC